MVDAESYPTNSCLDGWMYNIQMPFKPRRISYIQVAHLNLFGCNQSRCNTNGKYLSFAVHHKIILRVAIASEPMKIYYFLLRRMRILTDPFLEPFLTLTCHIFIVQSGRRPNMTFIGWKIFAEFVFPIPSALVQFVALPNHCSERFNFFQYNFIE